jgi:hypothetical protein
VWEDTIADWLEGHTVTTITEILSDLLRIETHTQDKRSQMRVRDVLIRLNWLPAPSPRIYKAKKQRVWEKQ